MSYQYEVTVDAHVCEVFRMMTTHVLGQQGFRTGLHVPTLRGVGVVEYHRNDDVVTFSTTEEAHGQRRLKLSSETVDVMALVVSVVEQLAVDLTASFWAPATGVSEETLARDVGRALKRIWKRAASGGGATRGR